MNGTILNQTQAAEHLGTTRNRLRRWTRCGLVPYWADPETGHPVYSTIALDEWQAQTGRNAAQVKP